LSAIGAIHERTTSLLFGVAIKPPGADGTLKAGTIAVEATEATLVPTEFVAVTPKE